MAENKKFMDSSLPLTVSWGELHKDFPLHTHNYHELVIIVKGHGIHIADGIEYQLQDGDIFILKENQTHGFHVRETKLQLLNISYDPKYFSSAFIKLREITGFNVLFTIEPLYRKGYIFNSHFRLRRGQLQNIVNLSRAIKGELDQHPPGYRSMVEALFRQLVITLSRYYSSFPTDRRSTMFNMGNILSFIDKHYNENITLPDLAAQANMSVNNFLRVFKSVTGYSPIDYLLNVRLRNAGRLLANTGKSITEIAHETGFRDGNYFSRQFKRLVGLSPRDYRTGQLNTS